MCEGYEWLDWQREIERAKQQKAEGLKQQGKTAAPPASPAPEQQQEEPVPA